MSKPASKLAERLRQHIAGTAPTARRFPSELRDQVVAFAAGRRRQGATWSDIQHELGGHLSSASLATWAAKKRPIPRSAAVLPIRIVPESKSQGTSLIIRRSDGTEIQLDRLSPQACVEAVSLILLGRRSRT